MELPTNLVKTSVTGSSVVYAIGTGAATVFEYLPHIVGALASLAGLTLAGLQIYFLLKDRKAQGK